MLQDTIATNGQKCLMPMHFQFSKRTVFLIKKQPIHSAKIFWKEVELNIQWYFTNASEGRNLPLMRC